MDIIIPTVSGVVFLSLVIFVIKYLKNGFSNFAINKRIYFMVCFSTILTFMSMLILILRIKAYDMFTLYMVLGTVFCITLIFILYYLSKLYLNRQCPNYVLYIRIPRYCIFVASTLSAVSISILLGWGIYVIVFLLKLNF